MFLGEENVGNIRLLLKSMLFGSKVTVRRPRPWAVGHSQLRSDLSVTPRHELVETRDLVIGNAAENIGQPCLRINAVQLGGLDQRIGDGRGFGRAF